MKPDLVLAGSYGSLASVDLLRGLGVKVVQVPPIISLAEVPQQILLVGQALGREHGDLALAFGERRGAPGVRLSFITI